MSGKQFLKNVIVYFIVFVILLVPANLFFHKAGAARIFSGTASLMKDVDFIVDQDSPFFEKYKDSKRVNVLVLGVNDGMTDTILVGSYDMERQQVDVISVPRDTYYRRAEYKGAAAQKINAIYHSQGATGTAIAVSDTLLGMPINYYAVIEYKDVEAIVEAIGGVPMDIPFHMKYNDPYDKPPLRIDIPEGNQVLDGKQAVQFLRYRHGYPEGDIGRVKAQQQFLKSAFKESLGFGLPKVVKTAMETVESDITLDMALKIAKKAVGLTPDDFTTYMVPGKSGTSNGASYWHANKEETAAMIDLIYGEKEEENSTESAESEN